MRPNQRLHGEQTSRRGVLAAVGAVAGGGVVSIDRASGARASQSVTVSRDRALAAPGDELERTLRDADIAVTTSERGVSDGVDRFLAGEADVLHARRPLLPDEVQTASDDGVEYEAFESVAGGASLTESDGWRTCLGDDGLTEFRESNPRAETWAELADRGASTALDALDEAAVDDPPRSDADVVVRGVRAEQYARGHGGLGYCRVSADDVAPANDADEGTRTPIVQLRYTYVNADALDRRSVERYRDLFASHPRRRADALEPHPEPADRDDVPELLR